MQNASPIEMMRAFEAVNLLVELLDGERVRFSRKLPVESSVIPASSLGKPRTDYTRRFIELSREFCLAGILHMRGT